MVIQTVQYLSSNYGVVLLPLYTCTITQTGEKRNGKGDRDFGRAMTEPRSMAYFRTLCTSNRKN